MKQIVLLRSVRTHLVDPDSVLVSQIEAKIKEGYQLVTVIAPTTDERVAYMRFVGGRI